MANVLEIILSGDTKQFDASLAKSEKRLKEFGDKMQNIGRTMSTYVTAPLALAGGVAVKFASDFNESLNKVDVAFGESSASVRMFAKTALNSFGIAEGTALDMSALFGDMATSMGISTKEASKLSTSMVGLAGDLSSFKNMNIEEVTTALNGVFTGETESLKRLGVVMTEVNLKQFAQAEGIQKSYTAMTQAEKVMLRYNYVMSKTANAQGDFARTGGGFANQFRMMTEGLKQLGQEFGQVMLPVLTKFIKFINEQVKKLSDLGDGFKGLIVVLGLVVGAIGPVIYAVGLLSSNFIAGVKLMTRAYQAFSATLLANPYVLIATAIAGVTYALYQWNQAQDINNQIQDNFEEINKSAVKSISSEIAEVNRLVALIDDENVSKENKEKLIKQLNKISPEYLGNIDEEAIKTGEATKAIDKYKESLLKVAKERAIMGKLQELQTQYVEKELETSDEYVGALAKLSVKMQGNLTAEEKRQKLLQMGEGVKKKELDNIKAQMDALYKLVDVENLATEETKKSGEAHGFTAEELKKESKEVEKLIQAREKLLETTLKQKEEQRKKDQLDPLSQLGTKGLSGISNALKAHESIMDAVEKGKKEIPNLLDPIAMMDASMADFHKEKTDELKKSVKNLAEIRAKAQPLLEGLSTMFTQVGQSIVDSLGQATTGLGAFLRGFASFLIDYTALAIKKISIDQNLTIGEIIKKVFGSGGSFGPIGIVASLGAMAGAVALVKKQFSSIRKFADGGIVSGPTMAMVGEYSGAKRNPEVIAPLDRLQSMIGGAGGNVNVTGEFVVRGQDLVLALQRADQFKNRIS